MLKRFATMTALALLVAGPAAAQTATDPAATPQTPAPTDPAMTAPAVPGAATEAPAATTPAPADTAAATGGGGSFIERQEETQLLASDVIGSSVKGSGDETVGEVDDVVLDRDGNAIVGVVIGVGGFLGVGEKQVALNFSDLQIAKDENGDDMLMLSRSREELEAAPDFKTLADIEAERNAAAATAPAPAPAPAGTAGSGAATTQ